MARHHAHAAYYMLHSRAFELMLGGILAINQQKMPVLRPATNQLVALSGLGIIFLSAFLLSKESYFPGINAMWPCLGAFLLLWSGQHDNKTFVTRLLSLKPVVFLGLMSYSLYLWHWPPIALAHYLDVNISSLVGVALVILSLIAGFLSYRFVELPTRDIKWRFGKVALVYFLLPLVAVIGFYKMLRETDGRPGRFDPEIRDLVANDRPTVLFKSCHSRSSDVDFSRKCFFGDSARVKNAKQPDFLLLGDSHANSSRGFFEVLAKDAGLAGMEISASSSVFLVDTVLVRDGEVEAVYKKRIDRIKDYIEQGFDGFVILVGRWGLWSDGPGNIVFEPEFEVSLAKTVEYFVDKGISVVLYRRVPEFDVNINPRCNFISARKGVLIGSAQHCSGDITMSRQAIREQRAQVDAILDRIADRYKNVTIIDAIAPQCDAEACSLKMDGFFIYYDQNHMNYSGSKRLGEAYLQKIGNPLKDVRIRRDPANVWK
jgi:hypothetical protein